VIIPRLLLTAAAIALTAAACHRTPRPTAVVSAPPTLPAPQISPILVPVAPSASQMATTPDTAREQHVDIDTRGLEVDVRPLLDFVAKAGGFSLLYSANLNRKVRVKLDDVPASVALHRLLDRAGLMVEPSTTGGPPPANSSIVFYQLPVNVDSLSVDAIMKRFGVGREIAELLVKTRPGKPH
jgi:hypothetical protein